MDKSNELKVDKEKFNFKYLPAFAAYIMDYKLKEFVTVLIRYSREEKLPMMKPLAKMPEEELVNVSLEAYLAVLKALIKGTIARHIEQNIEKYVSNKFGIIDNKEVNIEDISMAYFIKRKAFAYFLYGYTQNPSLQQSIISEVDVYTSQDQLLTLKAYMAIQKER